MKKMLSLLLVVALVFSFTACSGDQAPAEVPAAPSQGSTAEEPPIDVSNSAQSDGNSNVLVAYFSWADNAVLSDEVDAISSPSVVAPGNVQQLAGWVQEATQGDLLSIQAADPYPSDWDACLERANEEKRGGGTSRAHRKNHPGRGLRRHLSGVSQLVVWCSHGAAHLFGTERFFRQAGISLLLPRHWRLGQKCGDDRGSDTRCADLRQYFRQLRRRGAFLPRGHSGLGRGARIPARKYRPICGRPTDRYPVWKQYSPLCIGTKARPPIPCTASCP